MNPATLLIATVALAVSSAPAGSSSSERFWPQWRGPLASGVAPHADPPLEWSETENVRWKVEIPGSGRSTPIVWGNRVFITTAIPLKERPKPAAGAESGSQLPEWRRQRGIAPTHVLAFAVLAFDRRDGRLLWRRALREAVPEHGTHTDGSWASGSPVADGRTLIAHFGSHGTYALDHDGNLMWERDLGDMTTRHAFGEGSSPAMHEDTIVINWDHEGESFIVALDRTTGKTRWEVGRDEVTSWSTPIIVEHAGRAQVIVAATSHTRGYDLDTGKVVWESAGMTTNTIPSPVEADGRVFVMSGFRGNALQAIDLAAAKGKITGTAAVAWQYDRDTPYVPSPLLHGNRLYFLKHNKGILSCFDAVTGEKHYGPERIEGLDSVFASPVGAGGRIYVAGRSGTTVVLAEGTEFQTLASNHLDEVFHASPAIAGQELYLRGQGHLYCIAQDRTEHR